LKPRRDTPLTWIGGIFILTNLLNAQDTPVAPVAPQVEHQEVRHGATVTDNYFWLREKSNPEVTKYLAAENAYTAAMTKDTQPFADSLYKEMLSHIKQTDLDVPVRRGEYLYYARTEEGQQYPIRCRRKGSMDAPEEVLLDLNQLAVGKKFVGLGAFVLSDDQNLLAYTLDYTGFRQYTLQVKDLRTGQTYPDSAERVTSVEWADDNKTLFFVTEDAVTKRPDTLFRHVLGGPSADKLYHEADELYYMGVGKTRDKKFLLVDIESKDTSEFRYLRASEPTKDFAVFLPREKKLRYYVDHREHEFYIRTNETADGKELKDFQIVTAPEAHPGREHWKTFVPHTPGTRIEDIEPFKDFMVVVDKTQALNRLRVYNFATAGWNEIQFPEPVYAASAGANPEYQTEKFRYNYQSLTTPPSVFDYSVKAGNSVLLKRQEVPGGYDPSHYASKRLWATARDGTRVPISLVYKKGFPRDGSGPLFLYGYGSYGIGMPATFSSSRLALLDRGMAYAIAHIRGGDEMGEQWREDGMLMKKKNTFYDFIDCAEYLIKDRWTTSRRLVIEGGSAGGLLIGAVVNLRPDLFRAAHLAVPFVDVMNTMMDASLPLTVGEYLEWGNPNEKAAYDYMKTYSPYDNLEKRAYPAILVTSSFNDSQVMYWEPSKYVARLRTLKTDHNPLLLKMKMDPAGHGGASGRYDRLKDTAFEYAWLLEQVGIDR
jgi:oligopeptidase B